MILVATLVFGPLIYLVIVVRVRLCKRESYISRVLPLHRCMWFVYGAMMRQGSELKPTYDSSRILFATWWLFITLVTSFYTANLTAFLTFNGLQLPITTVEDLRKIHSLTWLAFTDGALVEVISTHPRLQILRDLQKAGRGRFVTSRAEAVALVRTNKYVFIDDMQVLEYLLREDFKTQRRDNASDMCNFYITPLASANDKDFLFWFGYGFRKDSEYKELFNEFFRRLSFFGILNFLHDNATSSSPVCTLPKGFKDRSLQNKDFFTTYALTAIGIIAAAIALASELICRLSRWKQRQTYGSNSQGSSTAITGRIVSILGIGSPETVETLNWNPANLPPLPEAKARAPFHVRYPHYTDSSNNNNNNNAAISIQMKRPQSPLEGSSPQYPHQQQQHPQQHSRGMENVFIQAQRSSYMIQGKINNTRVIWDQRRGKLIAEDATKINESVTYVDGVPQLFFKYTDQEGPKMQTLMLRDFV
ncbi:glutamate receptor ionotropic, delta-1-like [Cherax quadricarinatus]|uniref:glutamate receptor ionotropic, delta-1-like n=1 Tax=Cherax quadricarinatus TaxID=27406 RepID=UPI00387EC764